MNTRLFCLILTFCLFMNQINAQKEKEKEIINIVNSLFDAMRSQDTSRIREIFVNQAFLLTCIVENDSVKISKSNVDEFANAIGKPHQKIWDERIYAYEIKIDRDFAFCWTDYVFFYGDSIHHCGTNSFVLVHIKNVWKIAEITDNNFTHNCLEKIATNNSVVAEIDTFLNHWHNYAAKSSNKFFDQIAENGIYIGTDPGENWTKKEFCKIYKPYFSAGKFWEFKAMQRNIYVSTNLQYAWFDELLETWMGPCRASGYLEKQNNEWKIVHYHLSLAIPNNKTNEVIGVIKN